MKSAILLGEDDDHFMNIAPNSPLRASAIALHAFHNYERDKRDKEARKFVDFQFRMIPRYWEAPELLPDYVRLWEREG